MPGEKFSPSFESVEAERLSTGKLAYDFSQGNPQFPNMPKSDGPTITRPHPEASNPVLTKNDVTDVSATFVADPFLVHDGATFHMFFEISASPDVIGHATSPDGLNWSYDQKVLEASGHGLAYPYTFKNPDDGEWYMMPTTRPSNPVKIYQADTFPTSWSKVEEPSGFPNDFGDPTPFRFDDTWYCMGTNASNDIDLYYADSYRNASWTKHTDSPIVTSYSQAYGRPLVTDHYVEFWAGRRSHYLYDISTSSVTVQQATENEIFNPTNHARSWNEDQMHHLDIVNPRYGRLPIGVTDGRETGDGEWKIGIVTLAQEFNSFGKLYLGSNQSIPGDDSLTRVEFDTVYADTLGGNITDTSNNNVRARQPGFYDVSGLLRISSIGGTTPFRVKWTLSATNDEINGWKVVNSTDQFSLPFAGTMWFEKDEAVQLNLVQDSGSSFTIVGADDTFFQIERNGGY